MKIKTWSVLLVVLTGLVLISCSRTPSNYIGSVNNEPITIQQYNTVLRTLYESHILETGFQPDEITRQRLVETAWENIIDGMIFQQHLRRHNISVTYNEVIDYLLENIPELIVSSVHFRDNNTFHYEKYRTSLIDNEPLDLTWLKRHYYDVYIPRKKLEDRLLSYTDIPERDIRAEFITLNASAQASVIHFPPTSFTDISVTQAEIRNYYSNNRIKYAQEPYASLNYVIIPLKPSYADSLRTKTIVDSVYTELLDGVDFRLLAELNSDGPTARDGGELPFIDLTSLPASVRNTVANMPPGSHTRPFNTNDGWVIYQVVQRTRNLIKLREIFIEHKPSSGTRQDKYQDIVNIRNLALDIGLVVTAQEIDVKLYTADNLNPKNMEIPILGKSDTIAERAFNAEPGSIFEPRYRNDLNAYVIIEVAESQRRDYQPLANVADEIKKILTRQKQFEMAREEAKRFHSSFRYDRIIPQAKLQGYRVLEFESFNINSSITNETNIKPLAKEMLANRKSNFAAPPVQLENGSYIGVVHSFFPADMSLYQAERDRLRNNLIENMRETFFSNWMAEQIRKAKIRDWR